jgi:hypothetical protein
VGGRAADDVPVAAAAAAAATATATATGANEEDWDSDGADEEAQALKAKFGLTGEEHAALKQARCGVFFGLDVVDLNSIRLTC